MKAFQAYSSGYFTFTADTPYAAATGFFTRFPAKRKCSVRQGDSNNGLFTITFTKAQLPYWKDVTKRTAGELPDA